MDSLSRAAIAPARYMRGHLTIVTIAPLEGNAIIQSTPISICVLQLISEELRVTRACFVLFACLALRNTKRAQYRWYYGRDGQ